MVVLQMYSCMQALVALHVGIETEVSCVLLQASVAGALSRDVIFARVAPSTYALKANIALHK